LEVSNLLFVFINWISHRVLGQESQIQIPTSCFSFARKKKQKDS